MRKHSETRLAGRRHLAIDEPKAKSELSTAAGRSGREPGRGEESFSRHKKGMK